VCGWNFVYLGLWGYFFFYSYYLKVFKVEYSEILEEPRLGSIDDAMLGERADITNTLCQF
jgi:hypothetical protein